MVDDRRANIQNTGLTTTDVLALIGAVTGIIGTVAGLTALAWDFYKWRKSEKVDLSVNVYHGVSSTLGVSIPHVRVTIDNIGKITTTINLVIIEIYPDSWLNTKSIDVWVQFEGDKDYLPVPLEPGKQWTGYLQADSNQVKEYSPKGIPYVSVYYAHSKKPIKVKLPNNPFLRNKTK